MDDNGMQSLWLRNVPTSGDTQIVPPAPVVYSSLAFSPDGNYIYFRKARNAVQSFFDLYRAPVLGGRPQTIVQNIDSDITFSPEAQRIAYVRANDPEGGNTGCLAPTLMAETKGFCRLYLVRISHTPCPGHQTEKRLLTAVSSRTTCWAEWICLM